MNLVEKLRLVGQSKVSIMDPPDGYVESLNLDVEIMSDDANWFQIFVTTSDQLDGFLDSLQIDPDSIGWISYPKARQLGTDLNRDIIWKMLNDRGLRPVTQVSIDETWSALRIKQLS